MAEEEVNKKIEQLEKEILDVKRQLNVLMSSLHKKRDLSAEELKNLQKQEMQVGDVFYKLSELTSKEARDDVMKSLKKVASK